MLNTLEITTAKFKKGQFFTGETELLDYRV